MRSPEPPVPVQDRITGRDDVILTQHIAASSVESIAGLHVEAAEQIIKLLREAGRLPAAVTRTFDNAAVGDGTIVEDGVVVGFRYRDDCGPAVIGANGILRTGALIYGDVRIGDFFQTGHYAVIRAKVRIGDYCTVFHHCTIEGIVRLGTGVRIMANTYVPSRTWIGDHVFIGPGVTILNDRIPGRHETPETPRGATIEDDVMIGGGVTLLPGIRIGERSFIAAGAVVTKDVPARQLRPGRARRHPAAARRAGPAERPLPDDPAAGPVASGGAAVGRTRLAGRLARALGRLTGPSPTPPTRGGTVARYPSTVMVSVVCPWDDDEQLDEAVVPPRDPARASTAGFRARLRVRHGRRGLRRRQRPVPAGHRGLRRRAGRDGRARRWSASSACRRRTSLERVAVAHAMGFREFQVSLPTWRSLTDARGPDVLDRGLRRLPGRAVHALQHRRASGGS